MSPHVASVTVADIFRQRIADIQADSALTQSQKGMIILEIKPLIRNLFAFGYITESEREQLLMSPCNNI